MDTQVIVDIQDIQDTVGILVIQGILEEAGIQDSLDQVFQDIQDTQDTRDIADTLDIVDIQDTQE